MVFEKPSLRTRMTFEVGMHELGGKAIYLSPAEIQIGKRETVEDVAHNLERWVDGIMIRTFGHDTVVRLAKASSVPVINGLSDLSHPCQGMADFLTIREKKGGLAGVKVTYVGDGNNVCHSLMLAAAKAGSAMAVGTPKGYEPNPAITKLALEDGKETGFSLLVTNDPKEAVRNADVVYTDVWASMGQESEKEARAKIFAPFQVSSALMAAGQARRHLPALPARPPGRGGIGRGIRIAPVGRVRPGGEPPPRAEGDHGNADGKQKEKWITTTPSSR